MRRFLRCCLCWPLRQISALFCCFGRAQPALGEDTVMPPDNTSNGCVASKVKPAQRSLPRLAGHPGSNAKLLLAWNARAGRSNDGAAAMQPCPA